MESAVKEVALVGDQLFNHSAQLRPVIDKFVNAFERNQRHKEFDGLLRASHSLVEAAETASEVLLREERLTAITDKVNIMAERMERMTTPTYQKEHSEYLASIKEQQRQYLELCEKEAMRKMRMNAGVEGER